LRAALDELRRLPLSRLVRHSGFYRTAPVDAGGPDFVNAVALLETGLAAPDLLRHLQSVEQKAGRVRPYPNAPRTLDLDLLVYGSATIQSPSLTVPHPRMNARAFVLVPMAEIAPDRVAPDALLAVEAQTIQRLL
jgi:2-amino-4-hydroxy-6-hydroxymethyldihydropteridine diphosphokinase